MKTPVNFLVVWLKISIFISLLMSISHAQAQQLNAREVAKLFYNSGCQRSQYGRCQNGITIETYHSGQLRSLPEGLHSLLLKKAFVQAQIWGDTILEGEYAAEGKTQLDSVTLIRSQQKILGFVITYSERAWYTGNCSYNSRMPQTLRSCEEGRIRETAFVSTNLRESEVDQNQFADFSSRY